MRARSSQSPLLVTIGLIPIGLLSMGGCTSIWREVPTPSNAAVDPKVRLDASWFSESLSPEAIERLTAERQQHIESTLQQRQQGKVGRPLDEVLVGNRDQPSKKANVDSDLANVSAASVVLTQPTSSTTSPSGASGKIVLELAGGEKIVR